MKVNEPYMCPDCRAGKRYITSENATREHELSYYLQFECERCGWETGRRKVE